MSINAYYIGQEIRDSVNELTENHWKDVSILWKLNQSYRRVSSLIMMTFGDWFLKKSDSLTPSNGLITMPSDCAKPVYLEEVSTGDPVHFDGSVRNRRVDRYPVDTLTHIGPSAYMLGSYIEVNKKDYSNAVYLWYQRRVPMLHFGMADAGGAQSLTFESANRPVIKADYYNGSELEVVSGTGSKVRTTIDDYTAAGVATTAAGTFDSDSVYGTMLETPVEAEELVMWDAVLKCLAKPSSTFKPEPYYFARQIWKEAKEVFEDWISTRVGTHVRYEATEDFDG